MIKHAQQNFGVRTGFLFAVIFIPLLTILISFPLDPMINRLIEGKGVYNFLAGTDIMKLSYWDKFVTLVIVSYVIATLCALFLRIFLYKIGSLMDWMYAIVYTILVFPVNVIIYNETILALHVAYGESRGKFNEIFLPILLLFNIVVLIAIAISKKTTISKNKIIAK